MVAAGLEAAGIVNEYRGMPFESRNSQTNVLRKHEGCNEESSRRQVQLQGALDQVGRQRAKASECWAVRDRLAGRTC